VLRAAGETETAQDWLELDEGDPGFQLLKDEEIASDIFYLFLSTLPILNFRFICFLSFCLLGLSFASLIRISEGLLYFGNVCCLHLQGS
jgi:hypothetical protein